MSQHDMDVANGSGATVRADMNSALQALATCFSGAAAPSTTFAFMWWADTANDLLKQRNAANSAWISVLKLSTGAALVATTQAAGVRSTAIATMQSFADEYGSSHGTSGWQKLPSGLIVQWGASVIVGLNTSTPIVLPIAWATSFYQGVCSAVGAAYQDASFAVEPNAGFPLTRINLYNSSTTGTQTVRWIVLGK